MAGQIESLMRGSSIVSNQLNQSVNSYVQQDNGGRKYISELHLNKLKELQKKFKFPKKKISRHFHSRNP